MQEGNQAKRYKVKSWNQLSGEQQSAAVNLLKKIADVKPDSELLVMVKGDEATAPPLAAMQYRHYGNSSSVLFDGVASVNTRAVREALTELKRTPAEELFAHFQQAAAAGGANRFVAWLTPAGKNFLESLQKKYGIEVEIKQTALKKGLYSATAGIDPSRIAPKAEKSWEQPP